MAAESCLPQFLCYYCDKGSGKYESIVQHSIEHHIEHALKLKKLILQHNTGKIVYQSVHFPIHLSEMKRQIEAGFQFKINMETQALTWVNIQGTSTTKNTGDHVSPRKRTHPENEQEITEVFSSVLDIMEDIGRKEDFISVIKAIAEGELDPRNISLHLLLDIGGFLSAQTIKNVRYNKTTMDFWSVVRKLFRGKATHFFRGHMASDPDSEHDVVNTSECKINFAVPSDRSLTKHSLKYKVGADKPGILEYPLDSFEKAFGPTDVKISMDV